MSTEIIIRNLGSILSGKINYSQSANAFIGNPYVSMSNNAYFNAVRFAEGIIIKEDIGEGYAHTFLNGLRIYSLKERTLLADRSYHCEIYSKEKVISESKTMLLEILQQAIEKVSLSYNKNEAEKLVDSLIRGAFEENQLEIAQNQLHKALQAH